MAEMLLELGPMLKRVPHGGTMVSIGKPEVVGELMGIVTICSGAMPSNDPGMDMGKESGARIEFEKCHSGLDVCDMPQISSSWTSGGGAPWPAPASSNLMRLAGRWSSSPKSPM